MKIVSFAFIISILFLTACNTDEPASPFGDLLAQPPYQTITDSIRKFPKRDDLYFRRAVMLNKNNQPEPALADFREAWRLNQQETYAVGISNLLVLKNADSTVNFLKSAIAKLPQSIYLKLTLAKAYKTQNRIDEALATTADILRSEPGQLNTLMFRSELQEEKGDAAAMVATLEKAHAIEPLNPQIAEKLAYQYAENKDPRALSIADSLIRRDTLSQNPNPYYIQGMYYSNTRNDAQAIGLFDKTISKDYNFLNAYIEKGKILFGQQKYTPAMQTFALVNRIKPAFPDGWYWLGRCQEKTGDRTGALDNYERAFALDKTFTEARDAADALNK